MICMVFTHFISCDFTIHQAPNLLTFYDQKKKTEENQIVRQSCFSILI